MAIDRYRAGIRRAECSQGLATRRLLKSMFKILLRGKAVRKDEIVIHTVRFR